MSQATRNPTINWCPPLHHTASGPTLPSSTHLPSPFTVLILGSSRGIGLATALAYAAAGASHVFLTGRSLTTLTSAEAAVRAAAAHPEIVVRSIECDVTSDENLSKVAEAVEREVGYLDVLVINAGVATRPVQRGDGSFDWPRDVSELDLADFRRTFDVNFFAVVAALKFCLPLLEAAGKVERKGNGEWRSPQSVIVITSSAIHHYDPKLMAMGYALSKFAAARISEYTHEGHKDRGVCSFAIQPGGVMTEMAKNDLPKGKGWEKILTDDIGLCGGFCVWLTKERREWLSGRWLDARWDVEELERRKRDIIEKDLLKFRLTM